MSQRFCQLFIHLVFSTKNRESLLGKDFRESLYKFLYNQASKNNFFILSIGGVEDHLHILFSVNPTLSISQHVKLIKGSSSRWIHLNIKHLEFFKWQKGYAAFSVDYARVKSLKKYIENQESHHKNFSFDQEYETLSVGHNF